MCLPKIPALIHFNIDISLVLFNAHSFQVNLEELLLLVKTLQSASLQKTIKVW